MSLDITTETIGHVLVVFFRGRLDTLTAGEAERLLTTLIDADEHRLVLDLAELVYVSSAGLRALLSAAKRLAKVQGTLALCALQPAVLDLFIVSGLDGILTIVKTQSDAIAAVI